MQALCVLDTHELNKWVWKKNEKAVSCYYSNNGIIYTMNLTFQHWFLTCPLQRCRTAVFKTGFFKDQTVTIRYSITSLQGRKGPVPVLCSSSISLCYHLYLLDKWFYDLQTWSFTKTTFSKKKNHSTHQPHKLSTKRPVIVLKWQTGDVRHQRTQSRAGTSALCPENHLQFLGLQNSIFSMHSKKGSMEFLIL